MWTLNLKKELLKYEHAKGSIKIPICESISFNLIKEIVIFRVNENKSK